MKIFEIYFRDLSDKAKKRFLEFSELGSESEGNFEVLPLVVFELEVDTEIKDSVW